MWVIPWKPREYLGETESTSSAPGLHDALEVVQLGRTKHDSLLPHHHPLGFLECGLAFLSYLTFIWSLPESFNSTVTSARGGGGGGGLCPCCLFFLELPDMIAELSCHSNLNWNDSTFWKEFPDHSNQSKLSLPPSITFPELSFSVVLIRTWNVYKWIQHMLMYLFSLWTLQNII